MSLKRTKTEQDEEIEQMLIPLIISDLGFRNKVKDLTPQYWLALVTGERWELKMDWQVGSKVYTLRHEANIRLTMRRDENRREEKLYFLQGKEFNGVLKKTKQLAIITMYGFDIETTEMEERFEDKEFIVTFTKSVESRYRNGTYFLIMLITNFKIVEKRQIPKFDYWSDVLIL
jgi:hypothetical protein